MSHPLVAEPLEEWVDPEAVYLASFAALEDSFWLDAGPDPAHGWSWIGTGERVDDPDPVRAITCAGAGGPREDGRFRGGYVGWLGYEGGAARAGAPTAPTHDSVPPQLWLLVGRFVA